MESFWTRDQTLSGPGIKPASPPLAGILFPSTTREVLFSDRWTEEKIGRVPGPQVDSQDSKSSFLLYIDNVYLEGLLRWLSSKEFSCPCTRFKRGIFDPQEMATHTSILPWKISWTEEPGELQSTGSQRVIYNWVTERAGIQNPRLLSFEISGYCQALFFRVWSGELIIFSPPQFPSFLVPSGFEFWVRFLELNSIDNKYVDHLWELSVRGSREKKKEKGVGQAGKWDFIVFHTQRPVCKLQCKLRL